MSSYWECHEDAVADAIHQERYGDMSEIAYDCPYCFGHEVFKHVNGSTHDVQCTGCERKGTVDDGMVTVAPEHEALTQADIDYALEMIPQWPNDRPLPEPYKHLEDLRKATT
jgi:hypothetical protein